MTALTDSPAWALRQVDVFGDGTFAGNPVAVVHDAAGWSDADMAAFARWTNLAETTFLLPPTAAGADYQVRIFTPSRELPFAGHPTLGSAHAWCEAGGQPAEEDTVLQQCPAGLVRVRRSAAGWAFAAPPLRRSGPVDADDLAAVTAALGVDPAAVTARWVDNGPGWMALLLPDAKTVLDLAPTGLGGFAAVGVVARQPAGSETDVEVRAFGHRGAAVVEDPATGSLNAGLGQWLIADGHVPPRYVAAQGTVLQRRGRIDVEQTDGQVWIAGATTTRIIGTLRGPSPD
jgi:PhzF family phenazine biosynthesis protein